MDIFSWFLFGPFFSLLALVLLGVSVMYFVMGIQNLVTGKREKSTLKTRSGYMAIAISGFFAIMILVAWYKSGGIYYLFGWFSF